MTKSQLIAADPELGKVPDHVVALKYHASQWLVCRVRRSLGTPSFRENMARELDAEVAFQAEDAFSSNQVIRRSGISYPAVKRRLPTPLQGTRPGGLYQNGDLSHLILHALRHEARDHQSICQEVRPQWQTAGGVSGPLSRLEKQGYVDRGDRCPHKPGRLWQLTDQGRALMHRLNTLPVGQSLREQV